MKKNIKIQRFFSYCQFRWSSNGEDVAQGTFYLALKRYGVIDLPFLLLKKLAFETARNLRVYEITSGREDGQIIIKPQSKKVQEKLSRGSCTWLKKDDDDEGTIPLFPEEKKKWLRRIRRLRKKGLSDDQIIAALQPLAEKILKERGG